MPAAAPALLGLVLAGGQSRRMGTDKGRLESGAVTETERSIGLLAPFCTSVRVSVRADQAALEPYRRLPLVIDAGDVSGPAAGLLAAWSQHPDRALLVLAVDMLHVDEALLGELVSRRDAARAATAFRHPDGLYEPLCTIWEPRAAPRVRQECQPGAPASLSRLLSALDVLALAPPDGARLGSANSPQDRRDLAETAGSRRFSGPDDGTA
jgi:molybdopterin-guanine dinucleotide biosynthesis protein A